MNAVPQFVSGCDGGVRRVLQRRDGRRGCMTRETVWRNVLQRRWNVCKITIIDTARLTKSTACTTVAHRSQHWLRAKEFRRFRYKPVIVWGGTVRCVPSVSTPLTCVPSTLTRTPRPIFRPRTADVSFRTSGARVRAATDSWTDSERWSGGRRTQDINLNVRHPNIYLVLTFFQIHPLPLLLNYYHS